MKFLKHQVIFFY